MTYPRGTLIRNATATRINHWMTAGCFVLLLLSGLSMFHPLLFWLSELFGGGQWTRAVHPWIGVVLLLSYAGMIVQFWRDNGWNRDDVAWMRAIDRVLVNEEEGVPEVGRFNAGQKFVFWAMALLIPIGPLRSRGTAARGRAPAFAASPTFGVAAVRTGGGVVPSAGCERPS